MLGFGNTSCFFIWPKGHPPMPCLAVFASSLSGYLMESAPLCFAGFSWAVFSVTVCTPSYKVLFLNRLNNGLSSENLGIRKRWKWSGISASLFVAVGQLCFTLYSLVSFFYLSKFWCCLVGFLGFCCCFGFCGIFSEKRIVCLLDLIYYLYYSNTYMIQAESENRTFLCLLTCRSVVRASLGQENVWE